MALRQQGAATARTWTFYGEYLEVDPPKGFKWTFMFDVEGVGPMGGPETFTLEEVGGKTKVTSIGHMGSVEVLEGALSTGMVPGGARDLGPPRGPARERADPTRRHKQETGLALGQAGLFHVRRIDTADWQLYRLAI